MAFQLLSSDQRDRLEHATEVADNYRRFSEPQRSLSSHIILQYMGSIKRGYSFINETFFYNTGKTSAIKVNGTARRVKKPRLSGNWARITTHLTVE